jgi:hypothetical protein
LIIAGTLCGMDFLDEFTADMGGILEIEVCGVGFSKQNAGQLYGYSIIGQSAIFAFEECKIPNSVEMQWHFLLTPSYQVVYKPL